MKIRVNFGNFDLHGLHLTDDSLPRNMAIRCFFLCILLLPGFVSGQMHRIEGRNYSTFTQRTKSPAAETDRIKPEYRKNPDAGLMPFNGPPCINCTELTDRRDAESRYFVENGTNGKHYFQQKSYGAINYKDSSGWWREINYRLSPSSGKGEFSAVHQPTPFYIDMNRRMMSATVKGEALYFNMNLELLHRDFQGIETSLGVADWSDYTAGDDGIYVRNFYSGIDAVFALKQGELETSFVLHHRLNLAGGYLVMRQQLNIPAGFTVEQDAATSAYGSHSDIYILNGQRQPYFTVEKSYAFSGGDHPEQVSLGSSLENNRLDVFTPVSFLNDPGTQYPVIIDPVITTQNFIPIAGIAGTKYGAVCWTNSCDYFVSVPTPANTTITNVYSSFEYFAGGACFAEDGGFSIEYLSCHYPAAAPGVITCAFPVTNFNCGIVNLTLLPEFGTCLPAPQCASFNMDFTLHFFRCNHDMSNTCGAACVRASQPWIMVVEGHDLELNYTSPVQQICEGSSITVVAQPQYGVGPYTFAWSPAGPNNDTISVSPVTNTTYTVTVTDACGTTFSGTSTVNVTPRNNPGFTISPNPVCVNQPVTLTGNGLAAATDYDWVVPGSNQPGGVVNNDQSLVLQYSIAGTYNITLNFANGTCVFDSTLTVTVDGLTAASVALQTIPASAICPGDTMRFYATPTNGGIAPTYDWYIDGVQVQTGSSDSLLSTVLVNGSLVQAVMYSNSACASPSIDTASVFVTVSNAVTPLINIFPDTTVCPGANVTFTATPTNGGAVPSYQWTLNGVAVPGATASTFSTTINPPDTVVGVVLTSSLGCVVSSQATDSAQLILLTPVQPQVSVTAMPSGPVCQNDPVDFTAHAVNGGSPPLFEWYLNGVASGGQSTDSTFTLAGANNGDSISVRMTASGGCVTTGSDVNYYLVTVTAAVVPSLNVTATPSLNICQGDAVTLTAVSSGAGSSPGFAWYINGSLQPITDSVMTSAAFNDHDSISVIVTSSLTCAPVASDTDAVVMQVNQMVAPAIQIAATGQAQCEGDPVQLDATYTNGGSAPVIQWTLNGVVTGGNTSSITLPLNNGDQVSASLTSNSACATVAQVNSNLYTAALIPYSTPSVTISSGSGDTICDGQQVTLDALVQNGGSQPVYQWYINGIPAGNGIAQLSSANFSQGDVIYLVMTSGAPCITQPADTSNIIRIISYAPLQVDVLGTPSVCKSSPVILQALAGGGHGAYSFVWSGSVADSSVITVYPSVTTTYHVTLHDGCGSTPATDSVTVNILPGPVSGFSYTPEDPTSFNSTVTFVNTSQQAISNVWYFGDGDSSSIFQPMHEYQQPGTYEVLLVTRSSNGCLDSLRYKVVVREEISVYYPNAFTPNGDLVNELWQPLGVSLTQYSFTIWNRWGEKIFEGSRDVPWDGSVMGSQQPAPDGVYVYQVQLDDAKFAKQLVTGRVTLLR